MQKTIIDETWLHDDLIEFIKDNNGLLKNLEIHRSLHLDGEDITFNRLYIEDCVFTDNVFVDNINNLDFSISINSTVFRKLYVSDCKLFSFKYDICSSSSLELSDLIIDNGCNISLNNDKGLYCYNAKAELDVQIGESFSGAVFFDSIELDGSIISVSSEANLDVTGVRNLDVYGNYNKITIGKFEELELGEYRLEEENVYNQIKELSFQSKSNKGSLIIEGMEIEILEFYYFLNINGIASLQSLKIANTSIQNSNLGSINFNNVVFSNKLEIERSDISKITYSNVSWIEKTFFTLYDEELFLRKWLTKGDRDDLNEDLVELRDNRETYRQLKVVAQNMKNSIDALEFHRLEMLMYQKELKGRAKWNDQERIIVAVDNWASRFGQSWSRPLILMLVIHLVLYILYGLSNLSCSACIYEIACFLKAIGRGFGSYWQMLLPTHALEKEINSFQLTLDFLMRINAIFFIYHFVRATRKYAKG